MFLYMLFIRFFLNLKKKPIIKTKEDFLNYLWSTTDKNWSYSNPIRGHSFFFEYDINESVYVFKNMYMSFSYSNTTYGYRDNQEPTRVITLDKFNFDFTDQDTFEIHKWFYKNYHPDLYKLFK